MASPNILDTLQPQYLAQQAEIDRRLKMADFLRQQALTPMDANQMSQTGAGAPNQAIKLSPWLGVAQMLKAGMAGNMTDKVNSDQLNLNQARADGMMSMLRGDQGQPAQPQPPQAANSEPIQGIQSAPDGTPFADTGSQSSPLVAALRNQPAQQGQSPFGNGVDISRYGRGAVLGSVFGEASQKSFLDSTAPTDFMKLLQQSGIDPLSSLGKQIMQQQIAKQNNIPLQAGRVGAPMYDPQGNIVAMAPKVPDNAIPQIQNGQVVGVSPLPGAAGIQQTNAYAESAGKAQTKPQIAYNSNNDPVFTNELAASQGGLSPTGTTPQNADQAAIQAWRQNPKGQPFNMTAPASGGALTPAPRLGTEAGANNAQGELTKKYSELQAQNSQAQITSSYLQNIKQQAQKAAVGPMSDKIDMANGLLSMVGSERAKDAVTANDLLDKYSNQIIMRLGQGGLGTDAARTIVQSANPNAHMNLPAINEAADNLVGANEMIKAKANVLSPHGNSRDPVGYQQKEQVFDQNADPRIWQWKAIQNPAQKKAFAASVMAQDPSFPQKIQKLESIGAF